MDSVPASKIRALAEDLKLRAREMLRIPPSDRAFMCSIAEQLLALLEQPTCETCGGTGMFSASQRGSDGYDPCPDCSLKEGNE